ncbi:MAG: flagellar motor protein MotB [Terracidiphilus sp.]
MKNQNAVRTLFPSQVAVLLLASAMAVPAMAQQAQPTDQPPSAPAATTAPAAPAKASSTDLDKEGFWGHLNPFARKSWVKKRTDPINDRLSELDEVNAKNAKDIQDVDTRAQAGIHQAQSAADAANQTATAAGAQAQAANGLAQGASTHVDQLNTTVNGLDQYKQISDLEVPFKSGMILSADAKKQLDDMAASLTGHAGYIIEMDAHSPMAGSAGIQHSERMAEVIERYLVTEHQIPVYRMHFVALGNARVVPETTEMASNGAAPSASASSDAPASSDKEGERVRHNTVHIRLMENSLAAQDSASPHGVASATGAERP